MFRVLVTGSRVWPDPADVWEILGAALTGIDPETIVIVHGANPNGADRYASEFARHYGIAEEPHYADWDRYGRRAGPIRNQEMINAGADLCIAFPMPSSRGTVDCVRRARSAGIMVIEHTATGDETPR